ncbi:MAG: hypothetical protein ACRCX9_03940, partial [Plesiomonas shigelloides]
FITMRVPCSTDGTTCAYRRANRAGGFLPYLSKDEIGKQEKKRIYLSLPYTNNIAVRQKHTPVVYSSCFT